MINNKVLRSKLFVLSLLMGGFYAVPVLKATELRQDPDRITAMVRFINKGVPFTGETESQTAVACYDWALHAEQAHSMEKRMVRILFRAKLLNEYKNQYVLPENRTHLDEIKDCLNLIDTDVVMIEANTHNGKLQRLQAHGRIWYGLLSARFKTDDHYQYAWDFLDGVKSTP